MNAECFDIVPLLHTYVHVPTVLGLESGNLELSELPTTPYLATSRPTTKPITSAALTLTRSCLAYTSLPTPTPTPTPTYAYLPTYLPIYLFMLCIDYKKN
ncbi:hypothetical protein CVT25_004158 [Psilocybe cyanescens]|uniref:Uncharacterized protein n=1 Tax=Psilocybe cyanescens TaxID=93625 RepID=A0A409XKY6_PSICY|nr:hypothetical protein CVT25_004158 [Psilocybe cyanescens]